MPSLFHDFNFKIIKIKVTFQREQKQTTTINFTMSSTNLMSGLYKLYNCPYYWGEMKRNKAEALLDKKPFGSFLLFYNVDTRNFEIMLLNFEAFGTTLVQQHLIKDLEKIRKLSLIRHLHY